MYSENPIVSEKKLTILVKYLQKHYRIGEQEILEIIYEEWDLIESEIASHAKVEEACQKLLLVLNGIYRVA